MLAATILLHLAADASKPRDAGVNTPFALTKQSVPLSAADEKELAGARPSSGRRADTGRRPRWRQDVAAPSTVWDRILAFKDYPSMVPNTQQTETYEDKTSGSLRTMKVRMKIGAMGVGLEFFISHTYDAKLSVMTWTLDYGRKSDVIDSVGYWGVEPHPSKPGQARVFYSVDVAMPDWLPGFVVGILNSKALSDATGWVKTSRRKSKGAGTRGRRRADEQKQCKQQENGWSKGKCELPPAPAPAPAAPSTGLPRRSPSGCSAPPPRWRDETAECGGVAKYF